MVMMYVRFPLSLRNVEDLLFERGVGHCQIREAAENQLGYARGTSLYGCQAFYV